MGSAIGSMLLAHLLGDFYLQSDSMARAKESSAVMLARHAVLCAVLSALAAGVLIGVDLPWIALVAVVTGITHAALDGVVRPKVRHRLGDWKGYCLDQSLHIVVCAGMGALAEHFSIDGRSLLDVDTRLAPLLVVFASVLLAGKPGEVTVRELLGSLREFDTASRSKEKTVLAAQRSGRIIGVVERTIVVALALLGQYSAIAFVMTAKSIARFKKIEESGDFAEQYLIGTLASLGIALIGSVLFSALITGVPTLTC